MRYWRASESQVTTTNLHSEDSGYIYRAAFQNATANNYMVYEIVNAKKFARVFDTTSAL
jgi:hypothetical protein